MLLAVVFVVLCDCAMIYTLELQNLACLFFSLCLDSLFFLPLVVVVVYQMATRLEPWESVALLRMKMNTVHWQVCVLFCTG